MKYFAGFGTVSAVVAAIAAVFSALQLISSHLYHYGSFMTLPANVSFFYSLFLFAFFVLYLIGAARLFASIRKKSKVSSITAAVFTAAMVVLSIHIIHKISFRLSEINTWIFNALLLITFWFMYYAGGKAIYWLVDRCGGAERQGDDKCDKLKKHGMIYFAVIILGWSPWLYAFYPGSLWWDMWFQYGQYYGVYTFAEQQFPPFPTYIMGLLMDVGKNAFSSDNAGLFLYIILQTFICAQACTKALTLLEEIRVSKKIIWLLLVVYALFPDFGASAQVGVTNNLNYGLTLLACIYIYRIYRKISDGKKAGNDVFSSLGFIGWALISILWRMEMVYVYVLITAMLMVFSLFRNRRRISLILLFGVIVFVTAAAFSDRIVIEKLIGQPYRTVGYSKALSLPLMQVARFAHFHRDLVTDKEKEILGRCFNSDFDRILQSYDANLSDNFIFAFKPEKAKREGFYKVYWSFFRKDPLLFLESLIASSYGYYSIHPNIISPNSGHGVGLRLPFLEIQRSNGTDRYGYIRGVWYRAETQDLRTKLTDWLKELEKSLNLFFGFGVCTFVLVILCAYAMEKTKKLVTAIPYLLPAMLCLVCIASPVNDCGRYYMGIFYIMPFIFGITIRVCDFEGVSSDFPNARNLLGRQV